MAAFKAINVAQDALHNAHPNVCRTKDHERYARGVLVGLVSGIMAVKGCSYDTAVKHVRQALDASTDGRIVRAALPDSWVTGFVGALA
jgi:hypothetical protein